jgi:hypothetical protein
MAEMEAQLSNNDLVAKQFNELLMKGLLTTGNDGIPRAV